MTAKPYIKTGEIKPTADRARAINKKMATIDQLKTQEILWHLVKKHKFGLTLSWAITITIFWLLPFVPALILGY